MSITSLTPPSTTPSPLPESLARDIQSAAQRHGFSNLAAREVFDALVRGGGSMAQFDHPEFGGPGQWMRGGMVMVSHLFDDRLKARIQSLCADLAALLSAHPAGGAPRPLPESATSADFRPTDAARPAPRSRWPDDLGPPASSGSQNGMRYAWFPQARRLSIDVDGQVTLYDTGDHLIQGCSQQQSSGRSLVFTSQKGEVELSQLPVVSGAPEPAASAGGEPAAGKAASPSPPSDVGTSSHEDLLTLVERLAELRSRDVLTEDEFLKKKGELLSRL